MSDKKSAKEEGKADKKEELDQMNSGPFAKYD